MDLMLPKKKIIFLSFSNLSLISIKCLISKFNIKNYIIFSLSQDGNDEKSEEITFKLSNILEIPKNKIITLNKKSNYKLLSFIKTKKKINHELNKIKNIKECLLVTSINYGFIYYFFKVKMKQEKDYLVDEGITNWITTKNRFIKIKSIIYSIIFHKFIRLPNFRVLGNKNLKYYFGYLDNLNKQNKNKYYQFINLLDEYESIIKKNEKRFKIDNSKDNNYFLLILAKNIHFKKGVSNMIDKTLMYIKKRFGNKFKLIIKLHPGYKLQINELENEFHNKIQIISDNTLPIEFYNFKKIKMVFSPINSSLFLLNILKKIEKKKINFYKIYQKDLSQKLEIAKKYNFSGINITNLY